MRVWSSHINSLLAFNMWISIYVWHITVRSDSAPRKIWRRGHYAFSQLSTVVNIHHLFLLASRFHNNTGLKRFCFWQISRCHCYIVNDLFYFGIRFRSDFSMASVARRVHSHRRCLVVTTVDSSKTGTNLRDTTVGSSLSASRERDTETQDPPVRFFRCSLLSLHISIYQIIKLLPILCSSGSYRWTSK